MDGYLIDTNVLVYAHDPRNAAKQSRAVEVLDRLVPSQQAFLSVQCLTEFYRVATQRLPDRLPPGEALAQIERFVACCRVLDVTPLVVIEACRGAAEYGLSIWDAQIWAVARLNQVPAILTEDSPHGRSLEGVRYLNPFESGFTIDALG